MAKRKNRPQPGQQPQQEVQVDLTKADTIKCEACGNYLFITAHVIKRISPIMSPQDKRQWFLFKYIVVGIVVKFQRCL